MCSVVIPHGAKGWYAVRDCATPESYSFTFSPCLTLFFFLSRSNSRVPHCDTNMSFQIKYLYHYCFYIFGPRSVIALP